MHNKLHKIWCSNLPSSLKVQTFWTLIEPVLLYGSGTLALSIHLERQLDGTYTNLATATKWMGRLSYPYFYGILLEVFSHKSWLSQTPWLRTQGWILRIWGQQWRTEQCGKGLLMEFWPSTGKLKDDDDDVMPIMTRTLETMPEIFSKCKLHLYRGNWWRFEMNHAHLILSNDHQIFSWCKAEYNKTIKNNNTFSNRNRRVNERCFRTKKNLLKY